MCIECGTSTPQGITTCDSCAAEVAAEAALAHVETCPLARHKSSEGLVSRPTPVNRPLAWLESEVYAAMERALRQGVDPKTIRQVVRDLVG